MSFYHLGKTGYGLPKLVLCIKGMCYVSIALIIKITEICYIRVLSSLQSSKQFLREGSTGVLLYQQT